MTILSQKAGRPPAAPAGTGPLLRKIKREKDGDRPEEEKRCRKCITIRVAAALKSGLRAGSGILSTDGTLGGAPSFYRGRMTESAAFSGEKCAARRCCASSSVRLAAASTASKGDISIKRQAAMTFATLSTLSKAAASRP